MTSTATSQHQSRLLSSLIWVLAAVVAVVLPTAFFVIRFAALDSSLQIKADIKAQVITQAISASPDMWRFEEHRLSELLIRLPLELVNEHAKILDKNGELIAESLHDVEKPVVTRSAPIYDSGLPSGQVEVQASLLPQIKETALIALTGLAIAVFLFRAIRRQQTLESDLFRVIFEEKERGRVTLQAIDDAVITVDANERVDYLNPAAERLTQWACAAAMGRPLSEIFQVIDESTLQQVTTLGPAMDCAEHEQSPGGRKLALRRRDQSTILIEESAAPLFDRQGGMLGHVIAFRDVTERRRITQRITWAATHDSLTGLINRSEFESRVDVALSSAINSDKQHALCYLDLDQFKVVNDTCGHAAGDALLQQVAGSLNDRLRDSDTLARLGGDEFGVLLECCALERAQMIAADLLAAAREYRFLWEDKVFGVGVSIGVVMITASSGSRADIFSAADTACYAAKEQGRNRVCTYQSSDREMTQRQSDMGWASRLKNALEQERFVLYYQSYLSLGPVDGQHAHMEILLRLIDEEGKLVPPGSFIPAAERYNFMPEIDRWVIKTVFSRHSDLQAQMGGPLTCAINLSGTTVNSEGILDFVLNLARQHRTPAGAICFEITETAAINNLRTATHFMSTLRAHGFLFALDDFGVGTSSFSHLKLLPVDFLKIDGAFVRNIVSDAVDRAMVDAVNHVGHIMGLKTIGEFAESVEVIDALRTVGVDFAQGYGFHKPQPLPTLVAKTNGQ